MQTKSISLKQLADELACGFRGDPDTPLLGLATLQAAESTQLSFLANPAYEKYLSTTKAAAVILTPQQAEHFSGSVLIHDNPYLAYAKLSHVWAPDYQSELSIHDSAIIDPSAQLGEGVRLAENVVIKAGAVLADDVVIGANSVVGDDSTIGQGTVLHAGVTIYHGVSVGADCVIHSGVVLGSDGFGFAPSQSGWEKIAQLGGVVVGNKVEIGANTTIDRGALDNTVIGNGVILDNQIQIAHNVTVGDHTAMAACCAVAGSTRIGKKCVVGGASGIAGHLEIVDNVHITAMTMVIKSLTEPGVYSSGTGVQPNAQWRRSIARLRQLDKMAARLTKVEKQLKEKGA